MTHEIIILTDSRASAEFYSAPLLQAGYRVKWTSDEDRALAYVAHNNRRPDLVIVDHNPPSINGTVMLLSMREINPAIKIVMIGRDRLAKRFALSNGAVDFIKKPISIKRYLGVLRNYIEVDMAAISTGLEAMRRAAGGSIHIPTNIPMSRSPIIAGRRPRTRIHIILTVVGLLLASVSLTAAFSLSAMANAPNPEAAVVVSIHSEHLMETEDFTLFVNGNLEYVGSIGEGKFVRLVFRYAWDTFELFPVNVILVSNGGSHLESASILLAPGEIHGVNFYL